MIETKLSLWKFAQLCKWISATQAAMAASVRNPIASQETDGKSSRRGLSVRKDQVQNNPRTRSFRAGCLLLPLVPHLRTEKYPPPYKSIGQHLQFACVVSSGWQHLGQLLGTTFSSVSVATRRREVNGAVGHSKLQEQTTALLGPGGQFGALIGLQSGIRDLCP